MSRASQVILTNMCLIEDGKGNIVMQIRDPERYSWSGAALPGGHVEDKESFHDSGVHEIFEEAWLLSILYWLASKIGIRMKVFAMWSFSIRRVLILAN